MGAGLIVADSLTVSNPKITQHSIYIYFFLIPFMILAQLSRSLPVVTQIRGHTASPPPPSPATVRAFIFYRQKISAFSSLLVDSRLILL